MNKNYFFKKGINGGYTQKYWRKNEVDILKILSKLNLHFKDKKEGYSVNVPKFYGVIKNELKLEKINGETIATQSIREKVKIYNSVFNLLSSIDNKLKDRSNIKRLYLQFRLPKLLVLILICTAHKVTQLKLFVLLTYRALCCAPYILFRSKLVFAHKDLHDRNIILTKNKTLYLVDFEVSVLTDRAVDLATFFYYHRNDKLFLSAFFTQPKLIKYLGEKSNFYAFKFYLLFIGFYNLAIENGPDYENIKNYLYYASTLTDKLKINYED